MSKNEYPQIVANEYIEGKTFDDYEYPICPFCDSKDIEISGTSTTLVGTFGEPVHKYADGNHIWSSCSCKKCNNSFTREAKGKYIWYTDPKTSKILKGNSACFEAYIWTCSYCGGNVRRKYTKKNGEPNEEIYGISEGYNKETGMWEKHYREFYYCKDCGREEEQEHPDVPFDPSPRKLKAGWTVEAVECLDAEYGPGVGEEIEDMLSKEIEKEQEGVVYGDYIPITKESMLLKLPKERFYKSKIINNINKSRND